MIDHQTTIQTEADRIFRAVNDIARLMNARFILNPAKLACIRDMKGQTP